MILTGKHRRGCIDARKHALVACLYRAEGRDLESRTSRGEFWQNEANLLRHGLQSFGAVRTSTLNFGRTNPILTDPRTNVPALCFSRNEANFVYRKVTEPVAH